MTTTTTTTETLTRPEPMTISARLAQFVFERFDCAAHRVDVRHLWSKGDTHYFRVNAWRSLIGGDNRIVQSAFVSVTEDGEHIELTDMTHAAIAA
ncbi:MAG: hypothetical protein KDA32_12450 [Phycisphaerales bacterium]|nr:hypothetical protein [Phycisphaerales bacterium]